NEGDLHANVPCRLLLYGENEFLLSSFFDDKAKYSCLKNNGSIAETLTIGPACGKTRKGSAESNSLLYKRIAAVWLFLL
ncbi:MAG: hypothetical protein MSA60_09165, partial [Parabacteroides merdae]|nr:hypothetical protein [Parabacteroides merdae]